MQFSAGTTTEKQTKILQNHLGHPDFYTNWFHLLSSLPYPDLLTFNKSVIEWRSGHGVVLPGISVWNQLPRLLQTQDSIGS